MSKKQLLRKIAVLESINDQLQSEVNYVDQLMKIIGFSKGLETLKISAKELIEAERREQN